MLTQETCIPCRGNAPTLSREEQQALKRELLDWQIIQEHGIPKLRRSYTFRNFSDAAQFTAQVAALADQQDHHPTLITEWGAVTVLWWSHKIQGLHRNDFIMAAKCDQLYAR